MPCPPATRSPSSAPDRSGSSAPLAAIDRGFDVHVFERGEVGAHPIAWGHVRMFTPWRMNLGPASTAHLARTGWTPPDPERCPTGARAGPATTSSRSPRSPSSRIASTRTRRWFTRAVAALLKSDHSAPMPRAASNRSASWSAMPGGRENFLHAFALIDASGDLRRSPAGRATAASRRAASSIWRRRCPITSTTCSGCGATRYAGKRTLVIGAGASAITVVSDLARLADESPGTWRYGSREAPTSAREIPNDPLPERRALHARARALARGRPSGDHARRRCLGRGLRVQLRHAPLPHDAP